MSPDRVTRAGRGLRTRLVLGFAFSSLITAVVAVATTVVAGLAFYRYHPERTTILGHDIFGELPSHVSGTAVGLSLAAVVLVVVGVAVGSALLIGGRVLRPVAALAAAAHQVRAGDLDVRLEPAGHDELAALVTSFNEMTATLRTSVAELTRLEAGSRRFAADVSHELRTPLAAMTAVTELLDSRTGSLDPDAAQAVRLLVEGVTRLRHLVDDLMEITRLDAGTVELDREDVLLADAVRSCLQLRGWQSVVDVDVPEDVVVSADRRRLDVILANLVGNAVKYGAPPVEVRARADLVDSGRHLRLSVRDHGPGLAAAVLPSVFDRFFKAEQARTRSDSSGLGLAIALENARLHGGTITAANDPAGGAVFTVELPGVVDPVTVAT